MMKKMWVHILYCSYVSLIIQIEAEIMKPGMNVYKSCTVVCLRPKLMDFFSHDLKKPKSYVLNTKGDMTPQV